MKNNRLQSLFEKKSNDLLSVYITAGFPNLEDTGEIIRGLVAAGVDLIEIGMPFSDPLADGTVIQHSSAVALRNGMTLQKLFDQVSRAREAAGETPLILMGYLNPMIQYGVEKLFLQCSQVGIDAIIIPDLPFRDYLTDVKPLCDKYDLPVVMLITPETSLERVHLIDDHCSGFIYMVSSASTTGVKDHYNESQLEYFRRISAESLKHNRLIGFGISNPETYQAACRYSSGGIIGSLFIKCLERHAGDIGAAIGELLETIGKNKP